MSQELDIFKNAIIQIATPWGTGTGFYLKNYNVIVTNRHVIEGSKEVVISGKTFKKRMANLYFADPFYDLAFLEVPTNVEMPPLELGDSTNIKEGNSVVAIGHPYGLKFTATKGIVSKAQRYWNDVSYIQIDAAINPGNSGGPLIDENNKIIGVNTFVISEGTNLGFALPVQYLNESFNDYSPHLGKMAVRCRLCRNIVTQDSVQNEYCPHCGEKIGKQEFEGKTYIPSMAGKKIEEILQKLNYDIRLSRIGLNTWEIEQENIKTKFNYNADNHYVVGYTFLCRLPKNNIIEIYDYMLRETYASKKLAFYLYQHDICLATPFIYDRDLDAEVGFDLFKNLIEITIPYSEKLKEMGALPNIEDE